MAKSIATRGKRKRTLSNSDGLPKETVEMGFFTAAQEAEAVRAARNAWASLYILRFADGTTALVTQDRGFFPSEAIQAERQAYVAAQDVVARQLQALEKHMPHVSLVPRRVRKDG
jgi:hypothetical protein